MDLSSEICPEREMVRYLYPKDGISRGITTEKCISLIITARKLLGLILETGKEIHPSEPHVKLWNSLRDSCYLLVLIVVSDIKIMVKLLFL